MAFLHRRRPTPPPRAHTNTNTTPTPTRNTNNRNETERQQRAQIDDGSVFPAQFGAPFPADFADVARAILRRLFRVYAHMYHSHFKEVVALGEEAHLNTCFKHFVHFVRVRPRRVL